MTALAVALAVVIAGYAFGTGSSTRLRALLAPTGHAHDDVLGPPPEDRRPRGPAADPVPGRRRSSLTVPPRGLLAHAPRTTRRAPDPGSSRAADGPAHRSDPAGTVAELAVLVRAGLPTSVAWQHVVTLSTTTAPGPWEDLLTAAATTARRGGDVAATLRRHAAGPPLSAPGRRTTRRHRLTDEEVRAAHALAAAWSVAEQSGAPTADVLDRIAAALRRDADTRGAQDAALAGPAATATLLTWLPAAGVLLGQLIGASPVHVLLGTWPGRGCAVLGAVLSGLGIVWTRRLVRHARNPT